MKKSILLLLSAVLSLETLASNEKDIQKPVKKTQTYVLVHGAWQAPYVWDAVSAKLKAKGNKVIVVELPGHGSNNIATHTLSLDVYSDKVIESISKVQGKVILVGHSMGGMVITNVAEKAPSKISKLVYIGAFLPTSGQALTDLAYSDPDSKLGPSLVPSADQLTLDVKRENLISLFIADGSKADQDKVVKNYRPEPAIPFTNKVTLTAEAFGKVDKIYIKTLNDIVISPGLQDLMIAGAGIKTVFTINSSHSPFLAQPDELAGILLKVGAF